MELPTPSAKDYMRFLSKIDVRGPNECWPWTAGSKVTYGRGTFGWHKQGYVRTAPVFALAWLGGVDLDGRWALHTCHNAACCNPSHLYAGTREDNTRDMMLAGRHNPRAWPDDTIREMRRKHREGRSISGLSREYGLKLSKMQDIIHRRKYRWVTDEG